MFGSRWLNLLNLLLNCLSFSFFDDFFHYVDGCLDLLKGFSWVTSFQIVLFKWNVPLNHLTRAYRISFKFLLCAVVVSLSQLLLLSIDRAHNYFSKYVVTLHMPYFSFLFLRCSFVMIQIHSLFIAKLLLSHSRVFFSFYFIFKSVLFSMSRGSTK